MLTNFVKTIWAAGLIKNLEKAHIFASVANRNYEGLIKSLGDKVRVLGINAVTAKPYTANTDIAVPDDAQDNATELVINQGLYFNIKVNDVDAVQEKPIVLNQLVSNAAYSLRDGVDSYLAGLHADAAHQLYSTGSTPYTVTSLNVDDVLIEASETFGTNNVPKEGRYLIVPEWFYSKLVLAGLVIKTQNDQLFENGLVTRVLGWDIYVSNNLSEASANTDVKIIGGIRNQSFGFAEAINKIEAYRPERRFEDAVKGLYIFGGKVMRPDMTLVIHATKGTG